MQMLLFESCHFDLPEEVVIHYVYHIWETHA